MFDCLGMDPFYFQGGAAAFNPLSLSPAWWHKASAGTFQSNGGAAATADTDPVGQWQDQSGNNRHVESTNTARPILKLSILNSLPVLRFDGSNDYLQATFTLNQPYDIYIVVRGANGGDVGFPKGAFDGVTTFSSALFRGDGGSFPVTTMYAGLAMGSAGMFTSWRLIQMLFSGASSKFRENGGTAVTGDPGSSNAGGLTYGSLGDVAANFGAVDIAEVIGFTSALNNTDRQNLEGYFVNKYGSVLLP